MTHLFNPCQPCCTRCGENLPATLKAYVCIEYADSSGYQIGQFCIDLIFNSTLVGWEGSFSFDSNTYEVKYICPPPPYTADFTVDGYTFIDDTFYGASRGRWQLEDSNVYEASDYLNIAVIIDTVDNCLITESACCTQDEISTILYADITINTATPHTINNIPLYFHPYSLMNLTDNPAYPNDLTKGIWKSNVDTSDCADIYVEVFCNGGNFEIGFIIDTATGFDTQPAEDCSTLNLVGTGTLITNPGLICGDAAPLITITYSITN